MIYATDLDRTLIFSSKFIDKTSKKTVCIEKKQTEDGKIKEISYMCEDSLALLNEIKQLDNTFVVPVTTRSLEQYKRVEAVQDCKYAIVANGGIILNNGVIDVHWQSRIESKMFEQDVDLTEALSILMEHNDLCKLTPRIIDNVMAYAHLKCSDEEAYELLIEVKKRLHGTCFNFTLQGKKLYIIPNFITKRSALEFVCNSLSKDKKHKLVTSGDGKLDYDFLVLGNKIIIPDGSEVLRTGDLSRIKYETVTEGLNGTSELLNIVKGLGSEKEC